MSTLHDRLDAEFAPAWRPDPGDKLTGEVVGIGERAGEYAPYPIVTVRRDDGEEYAVHAFHTVLAGELAKLQPKLGDQLAIKYIGKKPNRAGTGDYHAYRAVKDGDEQLVDWSRYGSSTDDDPAEPAATGYGRPPARAAATSDVTSAADGDDSIPF